MSVCLCVRRRVGGANKWNLPSWSPICRIVADTIADLFPVSVSVRCDYTLSIDSFPTPIGMGTSYTKYVEGCDARNEILADKYQTLEYCQEVCDTNSECISYEFRPSDSKCQLSSTCTYEFSLSYITGRHAHAQPDDPWFLYVKNSWNFAEECAALVYGASGIVCNTDVCLDCTSITGCCVSLHQIATLLHNHSW